MTQYVQLKSGIILTQAEFSEAQGLGKAPSRMEIATVENSRDITRGYLPNDLIMRPEDSVLLANGGDFRLYDEVVRDEQVKTCRQQRELALIGKEWVVEPGDNSRKAKKAADRIKNLLTNIWDEKTQKMHAGVMYGYAVAELLWETDGSEWTFSDIKVRNRRRFGFLPSGELRLRTFDRYGDGEVLPNGKFWAFSTGADHDDDPYGLGLAHYLYWPIRFKKGGIQFWMQFLEKFGQPTAIGRYPAGVDDSDKYNLLQALQAIQSSTAIRIPEGMQIELLEAKRSGTADYTALYDRMNAAISKVILGHTGSTDSTPGRLGGEDNAADVREDLIKADADLICGSFNRGPARWLTYYNDGPDVAPPKVWRKVAPEEDLKSAADRDKVLFDMGYRPSLKYVTETYGDGYELAANLATQPVTGVSGQGAQFAEQSADIDLTPVSSMVDQLTHDTGSALKSMVNQIAIFAENADSLEQLRDQLLNGYGHLDNSDLIKVMEIGFAAADLAGQFDVSENG